MFNQRHSWHCARSLPYPAVSPRFCWPHSFFLIPEARDSGPKPPKKVKPATQTESIKALSPRRKKERAKDEEKGGEENTAAFFFCRPRLERLIFSEFISFFSCTSLSLFLFHFSLACNSSFERNQSSENLPPRRNGTVFNGVIKGYEKRGREGLHSVRPARGQLQ